MRTFAGIDLKESVPDERTICTFRHRMERPNFGDQPFHLINQYLEKNRMPPGCGTITDATIIDLPRSTNSKKKQRSPAMHHTRKDNQWHFGMNARIGVDSRSKLIHSVGATAAKVHDGALLRDLLDGD